MKTKFYAGNGIREVLDTAPYEWRATGTFGVERTLRKGLVSKILLIYVDSRDLAEWDNYLIENSVNPTKVLPDLKLISVDALPEPSKEDGNVVDISFLI